MGGSAVDGNPAEPWGELVGLLGSSLPPRIDDIDMPPDGRCDAEEDDRLARSRIPEKGEAVGGPRGAGPSADEGGGWWPG